MSKRTTISRRTFLQVGGMAALSAAAVACAKPPEPTPTTAPKPAATTAATTAPTVAPTAAPKVAEPTKPAATAAPAAQFQESPVLADLVKQGKLPALKDRLPVEPMTINRKGKYGGTLRMASTSTDFFPYDLKPCGANQGTPLRLSADLKGVVPNVWKGYEVSKDFKTVTGFMRKGLKWSDGKPHTADDWVFWYEDVLNNKEITPVPDGAFTRGGAMMKLTKVDDYTIRFEFAGPNPSFPMVNLGHCYAFWDDNALPAHYLKQFHIKYNPKAGDDAKANKFDFWYQWFGNQRNPNRNAEVPRLSAYVVDKTTPQAVYYKRNPYYWMVDSEGKQLPYMDAIIMNRVDDGSVIEAKAVAGEYDFAMTWQLKVKNYRTYKDGEQKGGYKTIAWKNGLAAQLLFNFNMNYPDEVWRKVFSDVRFRRAMSVAINRNEINETLFFGMGTPAQMTAHRTSRAYKEQYAKAWAQYDPDLANKLLDEMGLKWDAAKKVRLLPDGRPMQIAFDTNGDNPMYEMVIEYWKKIGVEVSYKPITRTLLRPKIQGNQEMMSSWGGDEVMDTLLMRRPKWFAPIYGDESTWAPLWGRWYQTKGKEGEEPIPEVKQLYEWLDQYLLTDDVQYVDKTLASQAENIWTIGTVADAPAPLIFNKDLKNVPEDAYVVWDNLYGYENYPEAWYFDR